MSDPGAVRLLTVDRHLLKLAARLKMGMTMKQVIALLGPPTGRGVPASFTFAGTGDCRQWGDQQLLVCFHDGKATFAETAPAVTAYLATRTSTTS